MSHSSVLDLPVAIGSPPNVCAGSASKEDELPPERKAALLARAQDIIAGRLIPEPLPESPAIREFLHREFGDKVPPPTPEAIRQIIEHDSIQRLGRGRLIAYCTIADGRKVVLAMGEDEIFYLLDELSDDEDARVIVSDTDPC